MRGVPLPLWLLFRSKKNKLRAEEVSGKLRDNRDLQHFLQNTQDVSSLSLYCLRRREMS